MTTPDERRAVLSFVREVIASHLAGAAPPTPPSADVLTRHGGAFVTLHRHGALRGCIGHIESDRPLATTLCQCAVAAATSDPRFPALHAQELPEVDLEVSLLDPLEPVANPDEVIVGRHGLLVELGPRRGLLLPQVATEQGWGRDEFIAQTCRKAGLPRDAWPGGGAALSRFGAEVFGERF